MGFSSVLMRGCSAAAFVVAAVPAFGQAQSGDVIMRRPIPFYVRKTTGAVPTPTPRPTSIPDEATPTPTPEPSTPTPTPTPVVPTPTPTQPTEDPSVDPGPFLPSEPSTPTPTPSPGGPGPGGNPPIISVGDDCDASGVCPTPTPSSGEPTPTDPDPTPTSGPEEFTFDPEIVTPVDGWGYGMAQWTYGPWSGAGQCGEQAHYTREVGCQVVGPRIEVIGRNDLSLIGKPPTQLASYSASAAPTSSSAIFDPSSSGAGIRLAQFDPNGGGPMQVTTVSLDICMDRLGPPPPNTYDGTKAACDYESVKDGYSEWTLDDPSQGTATCSSQAYRTPQVSCRAPDGSPADMQYCLENVREGGARVDDLVDAEYGNYSSCKTGWVGEADDYYCFKPDTDWEKGTDHYAYYTNYCARSNGDILSGVDEAACTGPKPADGFKVVGSCSKVFHFVTDNACMGGYNGENIIAVKDITQEETYYSPPQSDWCISQGATCCSMRTVFNDNYSKAPYGQTQVVATRGDYSGVGYYYYDEGGRAVRRNEEGPYFYNHGGVIDYNTDATDDFYISDPDNVLDGMPLRHPDNGGGDVF